MTLICLFLNAVIIPEDSELRTLGDYSFYGTCINQISISSNVVEIREGAFDSCESLERVNIPENPKLRSV